MIFRYYRNFSITGEFFKGWICVFQKRKKIAWKSSYLFGLNNRWFFFSIYSPPFREKINSSWHRCLNSLKSRKRGLPTYNFFHRVRFGCCRVEKKIEFCFKRAINMRDAEKLPRFSFWREKLSMNWIYIMYYYCSKNVHSMIPQTLGFLRDFLVKRAEKFRKLGNQIY